METAASRDRGVLVETLSTIWRNYLQAAEAGDPAVKQHWIRLFLFNFQFLQDESLQQEEIKSFFNPIPEEICSLLLEQVYEIISNSELFVPSDTTAATSGPPPVSDVAGTDPKPRNGSKNHNFDQLILNAPSDCRRIVALRTFLTHQLGQHLLRFLLAVDIKLIASQKSLCNLCINLFPNCPWSDDCVELPVQPATIFAYIGQLKLYEKSAREHHHVLGVRTRPTETAAADEGTPLQRVELSDFAQFGAASCTSDEIAYVLVRLLGRCVANECETTLTEQSMSVIALNFALNSLSVAGSAFGCRRNAELIKCQFLRLIELCLNNLFAREENIRGLQFHCIFGKLAVVLEASRDALNASEATSADEAWTADSANTLCAVNFLIVGILHNVIAIYSGENPSVCNAHRNLRTLRLFDEHVMTLSVDTLRQLLLLQRRREEAAQHCVLASIFKTLLRINDYLRHYEQLALTAGAALNTSGGQPHRPPRRRRCVERQQHCRSAYSPLDAQTPRSCFFQGVLLRLLPVLGGGQQRSTMRYLLRSGTCCCHYTLDTFRVCLDAALLLAPSVHQRHAYQFLHRKLLNAVFVRQCHDDLARGTASLDTSRRSQGHHQPAHRRQLSCAQCDAKLKSLEFHAGILRLYRDQHTQLIARFGDADPAGGGSGSAALSTFLKHLRHIANLLTNDMASGVLAEIVLPIFRRHKAQLMRLKRAQLATRLRRPSTASGKHFWNRSSSSEKPKPPTPPANDDVVDVVDAGTATASMRHHRALLHECLSICACYLNDIRLIKAFYNEENIAHLEELLTEPELIRGVCELIRIGIDNITFLGDSDHEQVLLSRRLITLQLNSSDRAAALFGELLARFARSSRTARANFWLSGATAGSSAEEAPNGDWPESDGDVGVGAGAKPLDILHIVALQWSLNYELLKTSQYFYNEFAKIYSIVVEDDDDEDDDGGEGAGAGGAKDGDMDGDAADAAHTSTSSSNAALESSAADRRGCLKHGDKTIIDILRLNYNALSSYLIVPHRKSPPATPTTSLSPPQAASQPAEGREHISMETTTTPPTPPAPNNGIDCFSSSLESLLSSVDCRPPEASQQGASSDDNQRAALSVSDSLSPSLSHSATSYDSITQFYVESGSQSTFLQRLQLLQATADLEPSEAMATSVVLFDIRNQMQRSATNESGATTPYGDDLQRCASGTESGGTLAGGTSNAQQCAAAATDANVGIIGRLFGMFGALRLPFVSGSGSGEQRKQSTTEAGVDDADLLCFYEPTNGECKKLLLKLFEATMAICIKGYQNEEVEKMEKHLRKLKAIILSHAASNWPAPEQSANEVQTSAAGTGAGQQQQQQRRDNTVLQTLQTLLKIAELSSQGGVGASSSTRCLHDPTATTLTPMASSSSSGGALFLAAPTTDENSAALPATTTATTTSAAMPPDDCGTRSRSTAASTRHGANSDTDMSDAGDEDVDSGRRQRRQRAGTQSVFDDDDDDDDDDEDDDEDEENGADGAEDDDDVYGADKGDDVGSVGGAACAYSADEGYEADGEVPEASQSEAEQEGVTTANGTTANGTGELWQALQPSSRYRTHILHGGICRLVVEILVELAQMCARNPGAGWCDGLAQLANRLYVIRDYLGGALFLLRGFAPVLAVNDARLKDLQQSILELIVELNTPDILGTFFGLLAAPQPPVELLVRYMSHIGAGSMKKPQPSVELDFPVIIDGKCISTSAPVITEQIDRVRNYHLHAQAVTAFTRSPCIIPVTHTPLWQGDGFTLSLWLQVKAPAHAAHKSASQQLEDAAANDSSMRTHVISVGSNRLMLSVYVNCNMQLVFEACKPNAPLLAPRPATQPPPPSPASPTSPATAPSTPMGEMPPMLSMPPGIAGPSHSSTASPFRKALKQTKLVLLNSFNNMNIFHAPLLQASHGDGDACYEGAAVELRRNERLPRNKWTHLVVAIEPLADQLNLHVSFDGLEQHALALPCRRARLLSSGAHVFQLIALGDSVAAGARSAQTTPTHSASAAESRTASRSTLDGQPCRLSVASLLLFNRRIAARETLLNLTAMGPDFIELSQCQVGGWRPNYGYLSLGKMCGGAGVHFGSHAEAMRVLREAHILTYTAQQPDRAMCYNAVSIELDYAAYGRPAGLILYGELAQNQLRSLQTATALSGGISTLLYLFARVVEASSHSATQALALDLLLSVALADSQLYAEFVRSDCISLIGYVVKTERCTKDVHLLRAIVNNACSQPVIGKRGETTLHVNDNTTACLVYPRLLVAVLERYSDWHRSGAEHSNVLDTLFHCVLALTRETHPQRDFNMAQLSRCGLVVALLNLCKVYVIESPNPVYISPTAAAAFVQILAVFAGSPPSPSLLDEVMKLLLLLQKPSECYVTHDRSRFYFLLTPLLPAKDRAATTAAANLSRVAAPFRRSFGRSGMTARTGGGGGDGLAAKTKASGEAPALDSERAARINRLRRLHARNSPYKRVLNEFEENLEYTADCSRLNKGALRLLSPVAVSKWRVKLKRRICFQSPTTASSASSKPKALTPLSSPASHAVAQQRISRKRLRINASNAVARSLVFSADGGGGEKRFCLTDRQSGYGSSSVHSLAASLGGARENCDYGTHISAASASALDLGDDIFGSDGAAIRRRSRSLVKLDFYSSPGIVALQEGLLLLLKDFLCLLPDNTVDDVLKHYIRVEFLLVLANHSSCAVRCAIIRLLAALTKRLPAAELAACTKSLHPHHLGNQLAIYASDAHMFEACVEWVSGVYGSLETLLCCDNLRIRQRFGLNALLAITTKLTARHVDLTAKVFAVLRRFYLTDPQEQNVLIEAGLLQCCMKALYNVQQQPKTPDAMAEHAILELLTTIGEQSLKSVGHINIVWDALNMLAFYQDKQPPAIVSGFRSAQAQLQLNWIDLFYDRNAASSSTKYKIASALPASTLTLSETRTRLDLLIDRCTQFFTVTTDAGSAQVHQPPTSDPSLSEITLFQFLVGYGISTNQRCNNFIAWGLQPSRPRDLRAFIVDALWGAASHNELLPSIMCDGKMIKSLLWLCLQEDLEPPIENLERLSQRLGIDENDSAWNLENELERLEVNRIAVATKQRTALEKTVYKYESLAVNCIESSMVTTRRIAELQNAERKLIMSHMKDYDETCVFTQWLGIIRRMTHEGAPWYSKQRCENSWELDDTEGPSRVHTRLRRCHLDIDRRFFMDDYGAKSAPPDSGAESAAQVVPSHRSSNEDYTRPLDFLVSSYDQQLNISLNSQVLYNFPAKYLPVDGEIDGEIIVSDHKLYFLATYRCKYFYMSYDIATITEIWLKRYQHQEKAFEIFLDSNQSLFFSLHNQDDWKIMRDVFCDKIVTPPDHATVLASTLRWREGLLTNWEYLMALNQYAGRTYNDLMQYPVFPWILANYRAELLDLTDPASYRQLAKPIAVQHPESEHHYINNYTYINNSMTNIGSLILKPYHYSSHYSNSGTVLHFLVRVPPFTSYFLRYQDNNFDLPDRTFHALGTTWSLASRDSPTDVKELIPEFFCLPEMFENFERFNFGCRQSGERVEDVVLPPWCLRDPRLFVLIHRQALESELTRNALHHWIDLIFGCKQSGEQAVQAINVFHPATYSVFLESEISDPIERKAVETMIKTYGQMPRQLFKQPHPATQPLNYCLGDKPLLSSVRGLRWGVYIGSPQLSAPTLGNIHKLSDADYLVAFSSTNVVYGLPQYACIMQGAETDTFNVVSWGDEDRIVRIRPLNKTYARPKQVLHNAIFDDITACGVDPHSNQLWFGHRSGRISVYKCTSDETHSRAAKGRQSYVRGLRLSYNSAFRKMTTKSGGGGGAGGGGSGLAKDIDRDVPPTTSPTNALPTTTAPSAAGGGGASGVGGGGVNDASGGAELNWCGPTVLVRHSDAITCIALSVEFKIAVSAGRDGIAVIWDLNNWSYVRTIERPAEIHQSPIMLLAISPTLGDIVTVHSIISQRDESPGSGVPTALSPQTADECFEVTEESLDDFVNVSINPNGKSILRLHSVNARYVQHIVHEDRILAVCYSYIKEGVGVNVIATAVEGGIVRFWSSWNLSYVSELITGHTNIKSITYSTHQHLVVLTRESHIQVWESDGLYGSSPKFPQIAYK